MTTRAVLQPAVEQDLVLKVLDGVLPSDMSGHAFIVGATPRGHDVLFSGDGMVWRFDCAAGAGGLPVTSRFVDTWDRQLDQDNPGAFQTVGFVRQSDEFGFRSLVNTALVPIQDGRLLATCDAGRPWEIDPATLTAITPVGYYNEWLWSAPHAVNPVVSTCAHPVFDPATRGTWYTDVQIVPDNLTTLDAMYRSDVFLGRWDGEGRLERWRLNGVHIQMSTHQLVMTEGYIVVVDTTFLVEPGQMFDPDFALMAPDYCDLYIINRADLTTANQRRGVSSKHIRLPIAGAHLLADWRNPNGRLTLYVVSPGAGDGSEWVRTEDVEYLSGEPVRAELVGFITSSTDVNPIGKFVIDAAGGALLEEHVLVDESLSWGVSLYARNELLPSSIEVMENLFFATTGYSPDTLTERVVNLYADYPSRVVPIDALPADAQPNQLFRVALKEFEIADAFAFPVDRAAISPVFVPRAGCSSDLDGYLLCGVLSDSSTEIWIFDAADLARGPVCRLGHPDFRMPWTLHTTWMESLVPRTSRYEVDRDRDAAMTAKMLDLKTIQTYRAMGPK